MKIHIAQENCHASIHFVKVAYLSKIAIKEASLALSVAGGLTLDSTIDAKKISKIFELMGLSCRSSSCLREALP